VYSPHNYSSSNGGVASFATYADFKAALDSAWGYVITTGQAYTAPLWVGEFGTNHTTPSATWWPWIEQYLTDDDLDWSYWAINGTQGSGYGRTFGAEETFGVLDTTWDAPASTDFLANLQALVPAVLGP
jgi:endoglucanase